VTQYLLYPPRARLANSRRALFVPFSPLGCSTFPAVTAYTLEPPALCLTSSSFLPFLLDEMVPIRLNRKRALCFFPYPSVVPYHPPLLFFFSSCVFFFSRSPMTRPDLVGLLLRCHRVLISSPRLASNRFLSCGGRSSFCPPRPLFFKSFSSQVSPTA